MKLATHFHISIYTLTALSGLMLAFGEEAFFPSGLTPILCLLAFFFNERHHVARLNLLWSNALGLGALGLTVFEFLGERADARLLAGAHFLVYLIWIVLFQKKQPQQYWWLFALGLLQVAVGTVLTLSGWYGLLMFAYLLLAMWTMAIFHLYQGSVDFERNGRNAGIPAVGSAALSQPTQLKLLRETTVDHAVQQDVINHWITPRFAFGVTGISVAGLAFGMAMFLLVPRVWLGRGNVLATQIQSMSRAVSGVTSEVRLGHLGKILESADQVMTVRFFEGESKKRVSLDEFTRRQGLVEPLFRGNVFETYEDGKWSSRDNRGRMAPTRFRPPRDAGTIRQEYSLNPQASNVLFAMRPIHVARLSPGNSVEIDPATRVLSPRNETRDRVDYEVFSRPLTPREDEPISSGGGPQAYLFSDLPPVSDFQRTYLDFPADRLQALQKLTSAWIAPDKLIGGPATMSPERRRALTIESKLRDSGEFTYTLNMEIHDPERDPVEDFLFNRKSGHCEYYASALALMLRAAGIPSRLVTGFKGAEYVSAGDYYEVQQRYAHAWVEAYFDNAWIVLDATPAARDETVRAFAANSEFWKNATTSLSALWSTYVISMSQNRQKEALYDPVTSFFNSVRDMAEAVKDLIGTLKEQFMSPTQLLSGTGAALLVGLILGVAFVVAIARRLWYWLASRRPSRKRAYPFSRWFRWLTRRWSSVPASRMIVEFYERFLDLVAKRGLRPEEHQTQREFAVMVEQSLAKSLQLNGLATLPRDVTDLYYRVRFGGSDLSTTEITELDTRMHHFAEILHSGGAAGR